MYVIPVSRLICSCIGVAELKQNELKLVPAQTLLVLI